MSKMTLRNIYIYRSGIDNPIVLYDKSNLSQDEVRKFITSIFSSPNISILKTSGGDLIFKPSKIDAIEIVDNKENIDDNNVPIVDPEDKAILLTDEPVTEEIPYEEEIVSVGNFTLPSNVAVNNKDQQSDIDIEKMKQMVNEDE